MFKLYPHVYELHDNGACTIFPICLHSRAWQNETQREMATFLPGKDDEKNQEGAYTYYPFRYGGTSFHQPKTESDHSPFFYRHYDFAL